MKKLKNYIVFDEGLFICDNGVHVAGEDTMFLIENIDFENCHKCLEIGVGIGVGAVCASKSVEQYYGVDINSQAVACTKKNCLINEVKNATLQTSDCFSAITERGFDIIFSNPPQLPTPKNLERADEIGQANNGGLYGRNVIDKIINESANYINSGGSLYLLHFDMCGIDLSIDMLNSRGFEAIVIATREVSCGKLSFERLQYISSFYDGVKEENGKYYYKMHILKAVKK